MLTGQRVVYLCATSMHSSHYWRGMAHLVFPQIESSTKAGPLLFWRLITAKAEQHLCPST